MKTKIFSFFFVLAPFDIIYSQAIKLVSIKIDSKFYFLKKTIYFVLKLMMSFFF